jgi:serine phosphatase RsbU (regulator of sigma subunit)
VRHVPAAPHRQGGDVYELIERPGEALVLVADVRGKGAAASGLAGILRELFRAVATFGRGGVGSIALALDEAIQLAGDVEDFATAVLLRMDRDGAIESVNCGHPLPLIVTPVGLRALNTPTCLPLGLGTLPILGADQLRPGERLFLYTDGASDARDPAGTFFDIHRQHDLLRAESLETALDALLGRVVAHARGAPDDDLTLILAQRSQDGPGRRALRAAGRA